MFNPFYANNFFIHIDMVSMELSTPILTGEFKYV